MALTRVTGYVWFLTPTNIEVSRCSMAAASTAITGVFAGGLTDDNVVIKVRDNKTEAVQTYVNPGHTAFQAIQDTSAIATCP